MISALELDQSKVSLLCSIFFCITRRCRPMRSFPYRRTLKSPSSAGMVAKIASISQLCPCQPWWGCTNTCCTWWTLAIMEVWRELGPSVLRSPTLHYTQCVMCLPHPSPPTLTFFEFKASIASTKWMKPSQCIDHIWFTMIHVPVPHVPITIIVT